MKCGSGQYITRKGEVIQLSENSVKYRAILIICNHDSLLRLASFIPFVQIIFLKMSDEMSKYLTSPLCGTENVIWGQEQLPPLLCSTLYHLLLNHCGPEVILFCEESPWCY